MAKRKIGCAAMFLIILIALVSVMLGGNEMMGLYFSRCTDNDPIIDCILSELEEPPEEGEVAASGVYEYKDYTVNVTANIPLAGGAVTGFVTGTCEGKVRGTYNGQDNGVLTGTLQGACAPFFVNIPASAEFSGTVNKSGKIVPFRFTGKGAGITHEGGMTLKY